jgi:hypothetical protein
LNLCAFLQATRIETDKLDHHWQWQLVSVKMVVFHGLKFIDNQDQRPPVGVLKILTGHVIRHERDPRNPSSMPEFRIISRESHGSFKHDYQNLKTERLVR